MPDSDELAVQSHIDEEERIRKRAHEIWLSHKHENGEDTALEDWLQAEREILGGDSDAAAQNRATVVGDAHTPDRIEGLGEGRARRIS